MKKTFLFIISFIFLFIPNGTVAASSLDQERTLEIAFNFSPPTELRNSLSRYKLFKSGHEVCTIPVNEITTDTSGNSIFSCTFLTEDGTFDFTLSAIYNDGSASPLSPPFQYTVSEPPQPEPASSGKSKTITYTWQNNATNIKKHKMYMNERLLCETSDSTATSLSCNADLINEIMQFSVTAVDSSGIESSKSNILTIDPADFPALFTKKKLSFHISYNDPVSSAGGYKVYHNEEFLCDTTDPETTEIICETDTLVDNNNFTIKAVDANGVETLASNVIVYNRETVGATTPAEQPLDIAFTVTPSTGKAPLTVVFDATPSTGNIQSYSWEFGDGSTGSTVASSHIYSSPGSYTATLTITAKDGSQKQKQQTIAIFPATVEPQPPSAVISTSTATGNAPLRVDFNAAGSTTPNQPMTHYSWDYGDGTKGNGSTSSHVYSTAGTYYARLTVTDAAGLSDNVQTPILVTGAAPENQAPAGAIIASPTNGKCPLSVYVDGSGSSDPDGSIANYFWNFGDGKTATGVTAQHTFTDPASYSISLTVTDNIGAANTVTREINCSEVVEEAKLNIEVGELSLSQDWVYVSFEKTFTSPVVIAGPPTTNDTDPAVVRVRNISSKGFEIRLQEYDYQDGNRSAEELVSYLVIEQGQTNLTSGGKIEAGFFPASTSKSQVSFQQTFTHTPVVMTTISSNNDQAAVTGRVSGVKRGTFTYRLQEEEAADRLHSTETVGYVAWQPGSGTEEGIRYEAGRTRKTFQHKWAKIAWQDEFKSLPFFLAHLQTEQGGDTTALRQKALTKTGVHVKCEEEQSKDNEVNHTKEVVGYLIIGSETTTTTPEDPTVNPDDKKLTLHWQYNGDESTITGFRFYLDNTLLCEVTDPALRKTSCNVEQIPGQKFNIAVTSINADGTESRFSTPITIDSSLLNTTRQVQFNWTFPADQEAEITAFRLYNNTEFICEAAPNKRNMTCTTRITADNLFQIKAVYMNGVETNSSNVIEYAK